MQSGKRSSEKIDRALRGFDPRSVAKARSRSQCIRIRVTPEESREIKHRARSLDVSVSELLRQLFEHAKDRL